MVRDAFDAPINFIDTADVYGAGRSEEMTGQAIRNLGIARDEVVVATKVLFRMGATGGDQRDRRREARRPARRQYRLDRRDAKRGGDGCAGRGQRAARRISGLDVQDAGRASTMN